MKKTLVLALCLMMALCATAFAVTANSIDGVNKIGDPLDYNSTLSANDIAALAVFATYTVDDTAIYNIDIAYGTFATTYAAKWNGDRHVYDLDATLTLTDSTVAVTNHANRNITATIAYADADDGVTYDFAWSKETANEVSGATATETVLEAANLTAYGNTAKAAKVTYTLAITANSVALDATVDPRTWTGSNVTGGHQIGTVTLTLASADAADLNQ